MQNLNEHININNSDTVDYWQASIASAYDYSPFGVMLTGRTFEGKQTICEDSTTLITQKPLEEGFNSWGSWTAMGNGLVTYVSGEMQVSNPNTSKKDIGASKAFTTGTGLHNVSFEVIGNTCATVVIWPPSSTPIPIKVSVKDNYGNVVASGNYTTAGTYNLSFTPASAGANYTLEFHMTKASAFCFFRVDDVLVSYDDTTTMTVCKEVEDGYRYGFQAQERDDEIKGKGSSYTAEFWQYDSRLGRRWNLDPKPNSAISPYAAFANNPIFYQDLLGDTIRIAGKRDQRIKTLLYLQTLTNDKLVLKGNKVIIDFKNSTNCNRKLDNGTELVRDLIGHEKNVTIYQTDGRNKNKGVAGAPKSDESNGVGKDQNVFINLKSFDYVLSESPIDGKSVNMLTPFRIALAHELIHAYYGMEGKDSPQDKKDSYIFKNVDDKMYRISQDKVETDTVGLTGNRKYTENKIREEQGMSKRVKY